MYPGLSLAGWVFVPVIGLLLVLGGFWCLLRLIPRSQEKASVRTDLFAVRASYWAIVVGLVCTGAWLLSAVLVRTLVMLKATGVTH
jgi:hypothetical protein